MNTLELYYNNLISNIKITKKMKKSSKIDRRRVLNKSNMAIIVGDFFQKLCLNTGKTISPPMYFVRIFTYF